MSTLNTHYVPRPIYIHTCQLASICTELHANLAQLGVPLLHSRHAKVHGGHDSCMHPGLHLSILSQVCPFRITLTQM